MLWTVPSECVQEGKGHLVGVAPTLTSSWTSGWLAGPWHSLAPVASEMACGWQVKGGQLKTCSGATYRSQLPCAHLPFTPSSSHLLWFHNVMTLTSG